VPAHPGNQEPRMLIKRIGSGLLLGGLALAALFLLPSVAGLLAILTLAILGALEFYALQNHAGIPAFRILGSIAGAGILLMVYTALNAAAFLPLDWAVALNGDEMPGAVLCLIMLALCVRQFPQKNNQHPLPTIACTLFGVMYVPFLMTYFLQLAFMWDPAGPLDPIGPTARPLLLYLLIVVKCSDMGAFFVGSACGRHKLFPRISPGKTWEGLAGGLAASLLASFAFYLLLPHPVSGQVAFGQLLLTRTDIGVLGLLLGAVGVAGDLVESLMKRAAGIKDSGILVPGMGGVLDVLDSLLFAAPVLYYYVRWFVVPS
jgi:phosphatidate cytidylyltransferase